MVFSTRHCVVSIITESFSVYVDAELHFISSMIYQTNPEKPRWEAIVAIQLSPLSVSARSPTDQEPVNLRTHHVSHGPGVDEAGGAFCARVHTSGKWTDLQSFLMPERKYVNALQDDNKNRKKPQIMAWVAILRQKHLYLRIQFLKNNQGFLPITWKKDITVLMKK